MLPLPLPDSQEWPGNRLTGEEAVHVYLMSLENPSVPAQSTRLPGFLDRGEDKEKVTILRGSK